MMNHMNTVTSARRTDEERKSEGRRIEREEGSRNSSMRGETPSTAPLIMVI